MSHLLTVSGVAPGKMSAQTLVKIMAVQADHQFTVIVWELLPFLAIYYFQRHTQFLKQ